jgi:hypothetical protein
MQEAKIRSIMVPGQPRQKDYKTSSQQKRLGVVAHTCPPSYCGKLKIGGLRSRLAQEKQNPISKITRASQAPVPQTCNPNYSGGRDEKVHSSKPAWANSSQNPISKKPYTKKRAGGVAQGVGPEFKPSTTTNKTTTKKTT